VVDSPAPAKAGAFTEGRMYNYHMLETDKLEFVTVAKTDELGNGERKLLDIDGEIIAVFNIAGAYFAIADVCSHDDGPVAEGEVSGTEIECPRHGARFDLTTGKALTLPAVVDIPSYPIRVVGDEIQIGLPVES
jgi:3-phenylpropionate/trans-cinnamate dioxygenase ferredoxin subunit